MAQDNTIVPFKPKIVTPEVTAASEGDQDIVKMLEFYLDQARAGKLVFAALAIVGADGVAASTWAPIDRGPIHTTQALGSVAYLGARFNQAALDGEIDDDDGWLN